MKNKFFLLVSIFSVFILISCATSKNPSPRGDVVYTEEDFISDEINKIKDLQQKNVTQALFYSFLLNSDYKTTQTDLEFQNCISLCVEKYNQLIEEENFYEALTIVQSFESLQIKQNTKSSSQLKEMINSKVPGLTNHVVKNNSFTDWINGTVTVVVDKGIKVENGIGSADGVIGSGFFISQDGYIVTNHHVIKDIVDSKSKGFSRLYVKLSSDSQTRIPAKVIGYDENLDLALLKVEIQAPYYFNLGSSKSLNVGDKIYVIGSPLGLESTLTSGIISAKDRPLLAYGSVFQLDAAVNAGNSGGPLIDEKGNVEAIVFAGIPLCQGLNFAIPVEYLKSILPYLYKGGEHIVPWSKSYGKTRKKAGFNAANEGLDVVYTLPRVVSFDKLIKQDEVIVSINNQKISTLQEMQEFLMTMQESVICKVSVLDSQENILTKYVYLEKRPGNPSFQVYQSDDLGSAMLPIFGAKLTRISGYNKKTYLVEEVIKGSIADISLFSENDIIEIIDFDVDKEKETAQIVFSAKKRKNGYITGTFGMAIPLDNPNYF